MDSRNTGISVPGHSPLPDHFSSPTSLVEPEYASYRTSLSPARYEQVPGSGPDHLFSLMDQALLPGTIVLLSGRDLTWSEARRFTLARDTYRCRSCGSGNRPELTVHHIFPRGVGGGNAPGNLVTLCERCHRDLCRQCRRPAQSRVSLGGAALAWSPGTSMAGQEKGGPAGVLI